MKDKIKKFIKYIFNHENEYTKKWMARFSCLVLFLLLFYPIFGEELLYFHIKLNLSAKQCKMFFSQYTKFAIVLITGYAVTFLGQMTKAYMAKQSEENIKLKKQLNKIKDGDPK